MERYRAQEAIFDAIHHRTAKLFGKYLIAVVSCGNARVVLLCTLFFNSSRLIFLASRAKVSTL